MSGSIWRAVYRSHDGSFAYQFNDDGRSLILDGYTYTYVEDYNDLAPSFLNEVKGLSLKTG